MREPTWKLDSWRLLAAVLAAGMGCASGDRLPTYPVQGQVLRDGKPVVGAEIRFHPTADELTSRLLFPHARSDADGKFQVTTYDRGDGAPEGEYRVTVLVRSSTRSSDPEERHPDEAPPDEHVASRFRDPDLTPLRATVKRQTNLLDPLILP